MKTLKFTYLLLIVSTLIACTATKKAVTNVTQPVKFYETFPDAEEKKILRGLLTKTDIVSDTAFGWYQKNLQFFKPNTDAVKALQTKGSDLHFVIFLGTWCHDTQQLLPKYLTLFEAAGIKENQITLIGTDREKTTIANLHKAYNIVSVPTLIVYKNGKEADRIVEFGKTALVDKELGTIVDAIK
jgi:thiol-disulfide isomerase/thioredoxin